MVYSEILKHCLFFKGEFLPPQSLTISERQLWEAEKKISEELMSLVDPESPRLSLAQAVYAYLGKWTPYQCKELMELYLAKCPDLRGKLQLA